MVEAKTRIVNVYKEDCEIPIMRPSKWGNPYRIGKDGNREEVLEKFRAYVQRRPDLRAQAKVELKGKVLGCCCKPWLCHGDVWVEICEESNECLH